MSYEINYTLTVVPLSDKVEEKTLTVEDLIKEVESKKITQEDMLAKLKLLKAGKLQVTEETIITQLRNSYDYAKSVISNKGKSTSSYSWDDYEKNLRSFSKIYPTWLFTLKGEGEESGDIWHAYFLNGKMQKEKAKIIINPFDEKKLN